MTVSKTPDPGLLPGQARKSPQMKDNTRATRGDTWSLYGGTWYTLAEQIRWDRGCLDKYPDRFKAVVFLDHQLFTSCYDHVFNGMAQNSVIVDQGSVT